MNYSIESGLTPEKVEKADFSIINGRKQPNDRINRLKKVVLMRLKGKTLNQIAVDLGVTTERIRQMEAKAVENIIFEKF